MLPLLSVADADSGAATDRRGWQGTFTELFNEQQLASYEILTVNGEGDAEGLAQFSGPGAQVNRASTCAATLEHQADPPVGLKST